MKCQNRAFSQTRKLLSGKQTYKNRAKRKQVRLFLFMLQLGLEFGNNTMSSFTTVSFIWQTPHTNAFSFTSILHVNFSFDPKGFLEHFCTCLSKEICGWCKFSFLLWDFGGKIHVFSALPGALSRQEPTRSGVAWAWSRWTCLTLGFYSRWKSLGKQNPPGKVLGSCAGKI